MSKQKAKISSFLKERKDRFKPDIANKLGLKRVHKIDFSGNIHLVEHKPTRTNMILVKNGDLLISGINAEKGGVSVFEFEEDAIATIHYSSYTFDETKINIDYLKWFLKSNAFKQILIDQAGSGIKSELKPKRFLPLEINLPSLSEQNEILKNLNSINSEAEELEILISDSEALLSKLRQSILQDAVQGKLTEEWRAQNLTVAPASELLKKIKAEKEQLLKDKKIKKEKPLPKITNVEIPFDIPENWEWIRLKDLCEIITKGSSPKWQGISYVGEQNGILFVTSENVGNYKLLLSKKKYVEKRFNEIQPRSILKKNDILMNIVGASIGRTAIYNIEEVANINQAVTIIRLINELNHSFFLHFFNSPVCLSYMYDKQVDNARPNLSMGNIAKFLIPIPSIEEQKVIVTKVNQLLANCDKLKEEISASKANAEKLIQSVLNELLGEENNILVNKTTSKKEIKKPSREIIYNSKTLLMDLVKLLKENGKLHAEDLWKMSKYPNDIDAFYAELKKQIEEENAIKEDVNEKGYLVLV